MYNAENQERNGAADTRFAQGSVTTHTGRKARFTIGSESSPPSSRSMSPAPGYMDRRAPSDYGGDPYSSEKDFMFDGDSDEVGRLSTAAYDASLPWWRAAVRRKIVDSVRVESKIIAQMQRVIRTRWLDTYFVYTSSLGTHTFFMIALPALFFFGHDELGQGLLMVLALGVYASSFIKDLFCSPRPFAPPVTRLTIGTHHLEYGFPSTHSTNSVSIALYIFAHIYLLAHPVSKTIPNTSAVPLHNQTNYTTLVDTLLTPQEPEAALSPLQFNILSGVLGWYAFSIVFGRLYTAMHSFTDCITGVLLGSGIWWGHSSFAGIPWTFTLPFTLPSYLTPLSSSIITSPSGKQLTEVTLYLFRGAGLGKAVNDWVKTGGWEVPLVLIFVIVVAVNQHPQPVDDCPCFEDAIAFGSVVFGALIGRWAAVRWLSLTDGATRIGNILMKGSGWTFNPETLSWVAYPLTSSDHIIWWTMATLKMVSGILVIFMWRILAKSTLHVILPPIFRLLSKGFELPNRRFYTPATDYKSVPSEFSVDGGGLVNLKAVPSVIDLPSMDGMGEEVGGIGSGFEGSTVGVGNMNKRRGGGNGSKGLRHSTLKNQAMSAGSPSTNGSHNGSVGHLKEGSAHEEGQDGDEKDESVVKHYDADVLTKVIVYAGIAILSTEALPLFFEVVGWGVVSSPNMV